MRLPVSAFALLFTLGSIAAHAERADREKEIVVGADHLTADAANRTSTFEGSVVATQRTMRMTAAKVTVNSDAERHKYYVAAGPPVTFPPKPDQTHDRLHASPT